MMPPSKPVIFLMGPTASGKTGLSLSLSRHFPIEIISVDSALIYQGMDIGTAKPSPAEQQACPHHLIDIISPLESYSAAQFYTDAHQLITEIRARNNVPVLVGGTMLYYKALMEGLSDLPQADVEVRHALEQEAKQLGWPGMHAKLAQLDPVTAARLNPNDSQRIHRALEVCLLSGQAMSTLLNKAKPEGAELNILPLALVPAERSWLHQRIEQRFSLMLEQGLLSEVEALRHQHPALTINLPSMRCVGYRQAWEHLDGGYGKQELLNRGVAATRQLAKRQLTWSRSMDVIPINAQAADVEQSILLATEHFLSGTPLSESLAFDGKY